MLRALELAACGRNTVSPNPMVGAVLVKNNRVISEFYHHRAGGPHAEVGALRNFDPRSLKGATLFVTLEPCCHTSKRTPPCANFLITSGVKDVVVAVRDPNPQVDGRGLRALRKAGIKVRCGLLAKEAEELNKVFFSIMKNRLPFVTLKLAMSLDGRIATQTGDSRWITGSLSRKMVHRLRSEHEALVTSSETVLKDNPHFGVRIVRGKDPFRVIIDRHLKTSPDSLVYRDTNVLVVTTTSVSLSRRRLFEKRGIELLVYPEKFKLKTLLAYLLKQRGIQSMMVEAGGTFAASFVREKLVNRLFFYIAPLLIGSEGKSVMGELGVLKLTKAARLKVLSFGSIGQDFLIEASL